MNKAGRPHLSPRQIDARKIELISQCKKLAEKLGRVPTVTEFNEDVSTHSVCTVESIFGSWNNLIDACGFKFARVTGTKKEDLIKRVLNLTKKLGKTPSRAEFNRHAQENNLCSAMVVQRYFGTWTEFLEYCNLRPNINK